MNIRCPQCQTVFRVNPERIPPQGVRARCARCGGTFTVQLPSTAPGERGPGNPPTGEAATSTGTGAPPATVGRATAGAHPSAPPAAGKGGSGPPSAPAAARPADRPDPAPWPGTTETAERKDAPVFGSRDPQARAARLARALVSDIVAYHPERRDESLASGTMRTEFREEIMKSWEEYVAQVGNDVAKSTPFFRDALNDILAKGQKIF